MVQSKKKKGLFLLFVLILPICLAGSVVLFKGSFTGKYLDLISFIFSLLFLVFSGAFVYALLSFKRLRIEDKTLIVSSLFGRKEKEIYLPLIHCWIERTRKNNNGTWYELTVFSDGGKYMINSGYYQNYDEIRLEIINYGYRDTEKEQLIEKVKSKRAGVILVFLGILFFSLCAFFYFKKPTPKVEPCQLKTVRDVLDNQPRIIKGSKGARSLKLKLRNYPDFEFTISGSIFSATYAEDFVNSAKMGDSILINIDSIDYGRKITNTIPLSFFDKTVGYKNIKIIEFGSKNYKYLNLKDYNLANIRRDKGAALAFLIMGLLFTGIGLFSRKTKGKYKI